MTVTPHTIRRSCTTELIRAGVNLWHVKELLGHENLDTLQHYARLTITDLKKTMQNVIHENESRVETGGLGRMLLPMRMTMEQIVEETSQWPEDAVADLVDRILYAKYGGSSADIDAAWRIEAKRRLAELESGQVQGVPLDETLAKARKIIGR